jgi:UTP--glucose-1-phosphate uridylyltransferase/molybdopterin molybdotransferase
VKLDAVADSDFPRRDDGKVHFVRSKATIDSAGIIHVSPVSGQGAHMLAALASSNALVVLDSGEGARSGDHVQAMLFGLEQL